MNIILLKKESDCLEEVLNELIKIDDVCKSELQLVQEKKDNIEYLVDKELTKRKSEIKTRYKFKIDMKKNEYDIKINELKGKIENQKNSQIEEIENEYIYQKENLLKSIIEKIII